MSLYYLLIINTIASIFASFGLWLMLPKTLQKPKGLILLFYFSFGAFIPIIGIAFLILGTGLLRWLYNPKKAVTLKSILSPFFSREKIPELITYGAGGAWVRIHSNKATTADRIQAIAAINATHSSNSNIISYDVLQDNNDELRLYAFGLLNKQEKTIDEEINKTKQLLNNEHSEIAAAKMKKKLASLYWELIYFHLVQDDLLTYSLKKAMEYALEASKNLENDQGLWLLLGKLYQQTKDEKKAEDALQKAIELGAPYEKTLPYFAAIRFNQGQYDKLGALLAKSPCLKNVPNLKNIVDFWSMS